ncbi:MAG: di-heme enzyme [Anaerolineae bacterium]|nr:di-heme enzyme [Anaerolineae bacterium]
MACSAGAPTPKPTVAPSVATPTAPTRTLTPEVTALIARLSNTDYDWRLPTGYPKPLVPADNPMTEAKFELGRYLFYDVRLSGNGTQSCASCHTQRLAFTDGKVVAVGSTGDKHPRNSQTLANAAYNATLNWADPTLTTIEQQIHIPMFSEAPVEMGITGYEHEVLTRIKQDARYPQLFALAFPNEAEPVSYKTIVYALAAFTRGLVSVNSPYDQQRNGEVGAMNESALRGKQMFFSERLKCHHCHTRFNLTASTQHENARLDEIPFFNTGLYNLDGAGAYPADNRGALELTNDPADMGRFRPPTLRNVSITAPYMHDGSLKTLDEVVRFYERGGRKIDSGPTAGDGRLSPLKNGLIAGFVLTDAEREGLIEFLESLTDEAFLSNPRFSDPFAGRP